MHGVYVMDISDSFMVAKVLLFRRSLDDDLDDGYDILRIEVYACE